MKAALFAVVSPLQYINALEAASAFGLQPSQCYLALGESKKLPATGRQVRSLIDPAKWRAIQSVSGFPAAGGINRAHKELLHLLGAREYARDANSLIRRARSECEGIDLLFIGDYRPANFRHFIGAIPEARVWLLDDGSVTHQVVRFRKDANSPHLYAKPFARENPLLLARARASGLRFAEPAALGYFTCYDVDPPPSDEVRTHDYAHFRAQYPALEAVPEVWFLGANHVENRFTSSKKYLALLRRVREFYRGEKVVYLPHRGENDKKAASIAKLGFEVKNFDLPIEIAIGQSGRFPRVLAGIASSAIDNLSVILQDRIEIHLFCVGKDYAPGERWNHLKDVIEYHQRDVFGITTFVHQDDSGHYRDRAVDYRLPGSVSPDPTTKQGGYYLTAGGNLRGPLECSVRAGGGAGARRLEVQIPLAVLRRELRVGDAVVLRRREGRAPTPGPAIFGKIGQLSLGGRCVVEVETDVDLAEDQGWLLEKLERRREYLPGRGPCAGVLFEPESENLIGEPRNWAHADWTFLGTSPFGRGSMTDSSVVQSPEGDHSSALLVMDRTSGGHSLERVVEGASVGSVLTFSLFARYGGCEEIELVLEHVTSKMAASARFGLVPDLAAPAPTGVRGDAQGWTGQRDLENGWSRCSVSAALPAGDVRVRVDLVAEGQTELAGDGCSGVYLWGAQLERVPVPTSPILPVTSAAPTRNAESFDVASLGPEGVAFVELSVPYTTAEVALLRLGTQFELRLDAAAGEARLRAGPVEVGRVRCGPIGAEAPLTVAVSKSQASCEVLLNGETCGQAVPCDPGPLSVTLQGGPFHLRRSYVEHGPVVRTRVLDLCSPGALNRL